MNPAAKKPPALVRFALLFCPREFRERYAHDIFDDAARENPARTALDALRAGIAMRWEDFVRNLGAAVRSLLKAPLFTIASVLTIAIAIGLNAAMASVIENVLVRPLPYPNSDRLSIVSENLEFGDRTAPSYPDIQDIRRANRTLAAISASREISGTLLHQGTPTSLTGHAVDSMYFNLLGMRPEVGRAFTAKDLGSRNILIADGLWREYFHGAPSVLGRALDIDGTDYTIVGVVPASFRDLDRYKVAQGNYWLPIDVTVKNSAGRGSFNYSALALLEPGTTLEAARADMNRVIGRIARHYPKPHTNYRGANVIPHCKTSLSRCKKRCGSCMRQWQWYY